MQTLSWTTTDKSLWGSGPWQSEPDKLQWPDPATGLPCLIVRGPMGALCGYVGVPPGHPWHRLDYSNGCPIPCGLDWCDHTPGAIIRVHGGLTFSSACSTNSDQSAGICHWAPGEPEPWWFGFDCAHAGDSAPHSRIRSDSDYGYVYRDLAYVTAQVTSLATQLKEIP